MFSCCKSSNYLLWKRQKGVRQYYGIALSQCNFVNFSALLHQISNKNVCFTIFLLLFCKKLSLRSEALSRRIFRELFKKLREIGLGR